MSIDSGQTQTHQQFVISELVAMLVHDHMERIVMGASGMLTNTLRNSLPLSGWHSQKMPAPAR